MNVERKILKIIFVVFLGFLVYLFSSSYFTSSDDGLFTSTNNILYEHRARSTYNKLSYLWGLMA